MEAIYIGLGSNLGDRGGNLAAAIKALLPAVRVLDASPVYQTEPWGFTDQPAFLNQVIRAESDLPPEGLLTYLKNIERPIGRKPTFRYGPRLIDLDILFYGERIIKKKRLTIPHPQLHLRSFVLFPLADLAPTLKHPVFGLTITELLAQVNPAGVSIYM